MGKELKKSSPNFNPLTWKAEADRPLSLSPVWSTEQVSRHPSLWSEGEKADEDVTEQEIRVPASASSRTWQLQSHGSGFRVKEQLGKVTEARHASGVSLNGSLERPSRPKDVGDAKAMGYLSKRSANRKWNQFKKEKCVAVNKAEKKLEI